MMPRSWRLTQKEDKASQTIPLEWLKRGWADRGNEEEETEKGKDGEKEEVGAIQIEHVNIIEDSEEDSFSDIHREWCEIYDRENEE